MLIAAVFYCVEEDRWQGFVLILHELSAWLERRLKGGRMDGILLPFQLFFVFIRRMREPIRQIGP